MDNVLRTYKFRLYPTSNQSEILNRQFEICRYVYNKFLKQRIDLYKHKHVSIQYKHQQRQLPLLKTNYIFLQDVYAQVLQNTTKRLDLAFKSFFRRCKQGEKPGFPRFKSKNRFDSITYPQGGFLIKNRKLALSKIGHLKIVISREIQGKIKTCTIRKTSTGKWYACLVVEQEKQSTKHNTEMIGIDLGITHYVATSNGDYISGDKFYFKKLKQLKRHQRRLSRKNLRSNNRRKQKLKLSISHEKVVDQRKDFQHKLSRQLVNQYGMICVEDLNIKSMLKSDSKSLNRNITDMAWGHFIDMLKYKAEEAGTLIISVDPRYTSQICSQCNQITKHELHQRTFKCSHCEFQLNRDYNASKNILLRGISTVRNTGINALGVYSDKNKNNDHSIEDQPGNITTHAQLYVRG